MKRRTLLTGAAAAGAVAAGAAGFALWARDGSTAWREAAEAIRRPLAPGVFGREAFHQLVRCATLAANSHNTQPWRFVLDETAITIVPDLTRRCPIVDPDDHHLFASLGAAAENVVQAAPAFGLSARRFDPDAEGRIVVELGSGDTAVSPLAEAIARRQCTRALYDGRAVPAADLELLAAAVSGDGTDIMLVTERPAMDALAALIVDGNTRQLNDPAFVGELKRWVRFSYPEALATGDGLFAAASGNPVLPTPVGRVLFDLVLTAESENDKCLAQVASSAGLAVFVSERNDRAGWVAAGAAYQRFALQATALGIKHAFLNQAVEVLEMRGRLADQLALGERRPDLVVRFGYGPEMPRSLRRPVADVLA